MMRLLMKHIDGNASTATNPSILERTAARGILLYGSEILMIYTKRYNDYSFPGGGVNSGEDLKEGLIRELQEETGAQNIKILSEFGLYEELRATYYDGYDFVHMLSYFFLCAADRELGEANPEDYEVKNGSVPVWVNIHDAIAHNKKVIAQKEASMGLSIERETFVLELIAKELLQ
jgi:ADP-ribose pyrophosphatase YjhB (NUDIX family)